MGITPAGVGVKLGRGRVRGGWTVALGVAFAVAGCGPRASGSMAPAASGGAPASPTVSEGAAATPAGAAAVAVLGGPAGGPYELRTFSPTAGWGGPSPVNGATAIGRDASRLILAGGGGLQTRLLEVPLERGQAGLISGGETVLAVAPAGDGRVAVVVGEAAAPRYGVLDEGGRVRSVTPGPRQPFSPLVGWLGDGRLLALSTDDLQMSRLAVVDPGTGNVRLLTGLAGVRAFAVSPDGKTIAAATEQAVYVAPVADWLSNAPAHAAVEVPAQKVAWHLALDSTGTRLAMLVGDLGADGAVSGMKVVAHERTAAGWQRLFEAKPPLGAVAGLVWLG